MRKPPVHLLGIGTARPPYAVNQDRAVEMVKSFSLDSPELERLVPLIYQKSSVQQRGLVVLEQNGSNLIPTKTFSPIKDAEDQGPTTEERMNIYKREAPPLAIEASRNAMEQAQIRAAEIIHLITVSCTGFSAPGFDIALIKSLGLSNKVSRTHVGFMGCHGVFNAFRIAQALASQEKKGSVLISSVELCSIHMAYGADPAQIVANALFSDGASSAVLSSEKRGKHKWRLRASGSYLFENSEHLMGWEIGNHGFRMNLSPEIPKMINAYLKGFLATWLIRQNLAISEIQSWAVHPGGPRILNAVHSALNLKPDALSSSRRILTNYGNMSSATVLYIVSDLIQNHSKLPCVALGFGPGLNLEIALFV